MTESAKKQVATIDAHFQHADNPNNVRLSTLSSHLNAVPFTKLQIPN
jgi:hypothetical protein